jgi:hypothetical protein
MRIDNRLTNLRLFVSYLKIQGVKQKKLTWRFLLSVGTCWGFIRNRRPYTLAVIQTCRSMMLKAAMRVGMFQDKYVGVTLVLVRSSPVPSPLVLKCTHKVPFVSTSLGLSNQGGWVGQVCSMHMRDGKCLWNFNHQDLIISGNKENYTNFKRPEDDRLSVETCSLIGMNRYRLTNNRYRLTNNRYRLTKNRYRLTNNRYRLTNNRYRLTNNRYRLTNKSWLSGNINNFLHSTQTQRMGSINWIGGSVTLSLKWVVLWWVTNINGQTEGCKVLKCGAGEGWRKVGSIVWEMKKYYIESRRKETSYIQYKDEG